MSLRARLEADETLYVGWSAIADPLVAELLARTAYDTVALDMQHGFHTADSVLKGIAAVALAGKPAMVRIPIGRYDMASRCLDFGATAVIAPMVNSVVDARAFAAAMKYPPMGERSWGPSRASWLHGHDDAQSYLESANSDTLAIAMVETRAAIDSLDAMLALEGIDGVLVGPSDLSIALSNGARVDPEDPEMLNACEDIARRTRDAGKYACGFSLTVEGARRLAGMGYRLIALGVDSVCLTRGAEALLAGAGE